MVIPTLWRLLALHMEQQENRSEQNCSDENQWMCELAPKLAANVRPHRWSRRTVNWLGVCLLMRAAAVAAREAVWKDCVRVERHTPHNDRHRNGHACIEHGRGKWRGKRRAPPAEQRWG